jgi:hypothetical protein
MEHDMRYDFPTETTHENSYDDGNIPDVDMPQNVFPKDTPVKAFPEEMPMYNYPDKETLPKVPYKEFAPLHPPTVDSVTDTIPDEVPRRDGPGGEPADSENS